MPLDIRAVIYARVSTALQEREQTVLIQLEALRTYLKELGYVLIAEYVDEGYSGSTLDRPELDRLRDAPRVGDMDVVSLSNHERWFLTQPLRGPFSAITPETGRHGGVEALPLTHHASPSIVWLLAIKRAGGPSGPGVIGQGRIVF